MTFNEWWAGQNLPEDSKVVALAAWYAGQLYNDRTPQHVDTANLAMGLADGAQLDALGAAVGLIRNNGGGWPEDDADFRARIIHKRNADLLEAHKHVGICDHEWVSNPAKGGASHSEAVCRKCGQQPNSRQAQCSHFWALDGACFYCLKCGVRR